MACSSPTFTPLTKLLSQRGQDTSVFFGFYTFYFILCFLFPETTKELRETRGNAVTLDFRPITTPEKLE